MTLLVFFRRDSSRSRFPGCSSIPLFVNTDSDRRRLECCHVRWHYGLWRAHLPQHGGVHLLCHSLCLRQLYPFCLLFVFALTSSQSDSNPAPPKTNKSRILDLCDQTSCSTSSWLSPWTTWQEAAARRKSSMFGGRGKDVSSGLTSDRQHSFFRCFTLTERKKRRRKSGMMMKRKRTRMRGYGIVHLALK